MIMSLQFPILGFVLYLFLGQDLRKNKKFFYYKKEEEDNLLSITKDQKNILKNDYIVKNNELLSEYHDLLG